MGSKIFWPSVYARFGKWCWKKNNFQIGFYGKNPRRQGEMGTLAASTVKYEDCVFKTAKYKRLCACVLWFGEGVLQNNLKFRLDFFKTDEESSKQTKDLIYSRPTERRFNRYREERIC